MNKSSIRYFDLAYEYQIAAITLANQVFDAPYLYNPIAYLLRHTIELQLKGLIVQEVKLVSKKPIDKIKVGKNYMNRMHSLIELWEYYLQIAQVNISEDDKRRVTHVVTYLNKGDYVSRYRYPNTKGDGRKKARNFPLEPIVLRDVAPDLSMGVPYTVIAASKAKAVIHGRRHLETIPKIIVATECLFDLARY